MPELGRRPVQRPGARRRIGTSIEATEGCVEEIERRMATSARRVKDTFTTIGSGMEERVNVATVLTKLVPKEKRCSVAVRHHDAWPVKGWPI